MTVSFFDCHGGPVGVVARSGFGRLLWWVMATIAAGTHQEQDEKPGPDDRSGGVPPGASPPAKRLGRFRSTETGGRGLLGQRTGDRWRPGPESNRRTRICSPLHSHSATGPALRLKRHSSGGEAGADIYAVHREGSRPRRPMPDLYRKGVADHPAVRAMMRVYPNLHRVRFRCGPKPHCV